MQRFDMIEFKQLELLVIELIVKVVIVFFIAQLLILYGSGNIYISCIYCPLVYLFLKYKSSFFIRTKDFLLVFLHMVGFVTIVLLSVYTPVYIFLWALVLYFSTYLLRINRLWKAQKVQLLNSNSNYLYGLFKYINILAIGYTVIQLCVYYFGSTELYPLRFIWIEILIINILFSIGSLIALKGISRQLEQEYSEITLISDLAEKIIDFFETSDIYLNPKFSVSDLANAMGVPKVLISQVINRELKISFYYLVGKYRITYAKYMLLSEDLYSINFIVEQCGFHSRSTFYKHFHKFVGLKPYQYRMKYKDETL